MLNYDTSLVLNQAHMLNLLYGGRNELIIIIIISNTPIQLMSRYVRSAQPQCQGNKHMVNLSLSFLNSIIKNWNLMFGVWTNTNDKMLDKYCYSDFDTLGGG